jgi:hypothetical protein
MALHVRAHGKAKLLSDDRADAENLSTFRESGEDGAGGPEQSRRKLGPPFGWDGKARSEIVRREGGTEAQG